MDYGPHRPTKWTSPLGYRIEWNWPPQLSWLQAYVASLGASLSPAPAYQQLAAASRLATLHREDLRQQNFDLIKKPHISIATARLFGSVLFQNIPKLI